MFGQRSVTSGVSQVLDLVLFSVFVSGVIEEWLDKDCLFVDDTKVCNRGDFPGGICNMESDSAWKIGQKCGNCSLM